MSTGVTKTHTARGYLWSASRVRWKTIHSLSCITSWLPYVTLCYIVSRCFLPLEQSRTALLGCRLATSRGCLLAIMGKLLQLSAYQQARWPLCKLWGEHRFSVPDLVSPPRPVHSIRTKTIPDKDFVHTQERWFRCDICKGAKFRRADLSSGESHMV